jgi:2-oxoglutarate ferredoxin oxidoreductase subunit alpha
MERLLRKWETAKRYVPAPVLRHAATPTKLGAIYYGSTSAAMDEAAGLLAEAGIVLDLLRVRALPFTDEVMDFIARHDTVFVVEQNRDGQLRSLLINEGDIDPRSLRRVLHYDGTPITARFITDAISEIAEKLKVIPLRRPAPAAE